MMFRSTDELSLVHHDDETSPVTVVPDGVLSDARLSDAAKLCYWRLKVSMKVGQADGIRPSDLAQLETCGWITLTGESVSVHDYLGEVD